MSALFQRFTQPLGRFGRRLRHAVPFLLLAGSPLAAQAVAMPPADHVEVFTIFADGFQLYRSAETAPGVFGWQFFGPIATLFSDAASSTPIGTHYNVNTAPPGSTTTCPVSGFACPSWVSNDGSSVTVGRPLDIAASPNPDSIPELLLPTASLGGMGVFEDITFVQRLDTVGGLSTICGTATAVGQGCESHYTATYAFFAQRPTAAAPEPDTWFLLSTGLLGLLGFALPRR